MGEQQGEIVNPTAKASRGDVPNKHLDENGVMWTKRRCFFCNVHCPIYGGVKDGKLVEVKPLDKQSAHCTRMGERGNKFIRFHYHPKRINHALKRVGKRGEDKWEQIPYDQALDEIAQKLQDIKDEYGPEALVVSEGTYRSDHLWARSRFTNLFGNPGNIIDPGTICWCWTYTLNMAMVGWPIETTVPVTASYASTAVLWGVRPFEKGGEYGKIWDNMSAPLKRKDNPGRMIVIDPVCGEEAKQANIWCPINPGTDLALQLAWINYIIENELYDVDFLKYWSNAVFLVRKDTGSLLRASEVNAQGLQEDFVVWDNITGAPLVWNSDENRYRVEGEVDAQLRGTYDVKLADGSVAACCTALDAIAEGVKDCTVAWAEEITGVPANKIVDSVTTYATNGPAFIAWGLGGADQHGYNTTNSGIAKTMLRILTGNIDNVGGEYVGDPGEISDDGEKHFAVRDAELELSETVSPEARAKYLGNDTYRMMSWPGFEKVDACYRKMWDIPRPMLHQLLVTPPLVWDAILTEKPYPVKAMIAWSSNPLAWAPNTKHVYEALKALDLLVVVDYWKTPTAALADYILPAADSLERPLATTGEDALDMLACGDRIIQPEYDRHMDYDFFRALGMRLGQEEYWPWETYEDVIAYRFERAGDTYDAVMERGYWTNSAPEFYKYAKTLPNGQVKGFATPSRKAELFSSIVQECGYDPIPHYRDLPETPRSNPALAEEYPLRLTTGGRWNPMYHSEYRVPGCGTRSMWPDPTVQLHASVARDLGIRDGDWVWIETPRGRIRQKAKLEWGIVRDVVIAQASWWFPELPAEEPWSQGVFESNANVLTDDSCESLDPMGGQWVDRGLLCKVYPCIDPADRSDTESPLEQFVEDDPREFFHREFSHLANAGLKK